MQGSRIPVFDIAMVTNTAGDSMVGAVLAAALFVGATMAPAGAAAIVGAGAPSAAIVRVADPAPAPVTHPARPPQGGTAKRAPTTPVHTAPAGTLIPPAALPGVLGASPQPRGPLPLATDLLPLGGETAAPEKSRDQPAPDKPKPPAS